MTARDAGRRRSPDARPAAPPTIVLVEGESDVRAVRAAAELLGADLSAVDLVSMNGVTNLRHELARIRAEDGGDARRVLGLYDAGEAPVVARMLADAGHPSRDAAAIEAAGFFACTLDLEDELIRALGTAAVLEVLDANRELARFRVLQRQPAHRGEPVEAQLHRFAGTAGGRKIRLAAQLVEALPPAHLPRPLVALLEAALR